ncbi:anaerobic glycerol-3-phosphate dehydrogenase subunit C [Propionispira raffinosivorans]|uniref:anaerobic glycerol-3-phosphate dehydrogenase subunit C n=1 Tax=Propionispira raffinosivorans TaxID=86959 RepID=UPI000373989D|nr:anaerobic glycerol-3-phosphate dehydrogenase subunit C [Propionispira raffinosivorans]
MDEKKINLPDCCISCTACITACPVTAATHKFRGPKMVGPAQSRLHFADEEMDSTLYLCSNCKNCDIACPSSVPISTMNMMARAKYYATHKHTQRDAMIGHPEKMGRLLAGIPLGAFFANIGASLGISLGMVKVMGLADERPLPKFASETFVSMLKRKKQLSSDKKVVLFPGCVINYNEPQVGMDFVEVMNQNGYEVLLEEDFACCGSPLVTTGYMAEVKINATKNSHLIKKCIDKGYPILTICTSCSLMLKQEYHELFQDEIPDVEENAKHIFDASEFLVDIAQKGQLNTNFGAINHKFAYHAPCHLRAQGIGLPSLDLLRLVPGLQIDDLDAGCCGISGNYGYKAENYERSMKIGENLFNAVKESCVDAVLTDCGTCRNQISHGAQVKSKHPMTILAESYKNN